MTEAQKEYIITEEQLQELIRWYPIDTWGYEKGSSFRSRPYKSDAVLDELITELNVFIHENAEMVQNKLEDKWSIFDMMIRAIRKELRQQKEREQG